MKTFFTITREATEEDKLTPQAKTIVDSVINKVGIGAKLDREDLVAELSASKALNSRQDVGRVISFYTPKLTEVGLLTIDKEGEAAPKVKKEKAVKEPKAAKSKEPAAAEGSTDTEAAAA